MPLFEVVEGSLKALRQIRGGADLYEREIEDMIWNDLEAITGEALFPVARQPTLPGGGRPDVVTLDKVGRVVVIEVKRDVDRNQLAQILEYAGWARLTSLDELAGMYQGDGPFFADWQQFTESSSPILVNRSPRLILVARDFQERTRAALDFIQESGVPVVLIPVGVYEHIDGRRFVDVESDFEPPLLPLVVESQGGVPQGEVPLVRRTSVLFRGRRVQISDLLEGGFLLPAEVLQFRRRNLGQLFTATVLDDGSIEIQDGSTYSSPSRAASRAAGGGSFDGWNAWQVPRINGETLNAVRMRFLQSAVDED
jgi:hypothetical protein